MQIVRPITGVRIFPQFWSAAECNNLIARVSSMSGWEAAAMGKYQDNEVVSRFVDRDLRDVDVLNLEATSLPNPFLGKPGLLDLINAELNCGADRISRTMVSRYSFGSHIRPHSDTGFFDTSRLATIVLYLNSDFEGGNIYFPDLGLDLRPETGDLLTFYSEFKHGVAPIVAGHRFSLVAFCENDLAYRRTII